MYKSFKFNNIWRTFQWMLFSNRRQLITYFIGIIIATFVGGELLVLDLNHSNIAARDIYFHENYNAASLYLVYLFAYGLWMLYGANQMFDFMKSKQSAITYLMHPATVAEKYVARLVYVSLLWAMIGGVGLLVGDFLRWIINVVTLGSHTQMAIVYFWEQILKPLALELCGDSSVRVGISLVSIICVWMYTFYILGSAVFRRYRLLLTTATLVFVMVCLINGDIISEGRVALTYVIFIALSIANIVGSYMIFKRMQVINNKWLNI